MNAASPTHPASQAIVVQPSSNGLGADILGFDFETLPPAQVAALRAAWLQHGVVRFRGYEITDEQQIAFTYALGDIVKHPRQFAGQEGAHDRYEEILVIGNAMRDGRVAGTMANTEASWHSDTFIYEAPPAAAILHAIQLPPEGGNTYFADMYAIYDRLPSAVRSVIEGRLVQIDVVFDGAGRIRNGMERPDTDDFRLWPSIRHPVVRTHGESQRKCVYIGADMPSAWIVGLPLDESRAIIDEILSMVDDASMGWTQTWQDGDMIMWDNRCTMHRRDGWPGHFTRVMHRTTTAGERPFYRF